MAEIKGIDVSRWNGNIDWKTVANYGMGFAILRITEKGNIIDSTFEPNYKGCIENKNPYKSHAYSHATPKTAHADLFINTLIGNRTAVSIPIAVHFPRRAARITGWLHSSEKDRFRTVVTTNNSSTNIRYTAAVEKPDRVCPNSQRLRLLRISCSCAPLFPNGISLTKIRNATVIIS